MQARYIPIFFAIAAVSGCDLIVPAGQGGTFREPSKVRVYREGPNDAPTGTCWGKDETQAIVETHAEQVIEKPAVRDAQGQIIEPAIIRTETRQRIVENRAPVWFETPCAEQFTPEFISSLQRALSLRGLYNGLDHGQMDPATEAAIRIYQKDQGLNSPVLSMVAARKLGLVAYSRDDIRRF